MPACLNCGASNPEGARFCSSCGGVLSALCSNCGEPLPAGSRFCPNCGAKVDQPSGAGARERKLVTVLFCDVTGSTTLGEQLDPERMREVLDSFFAAMREEIEAEGGTVEKFIGDAVMAAFGVPQAHEDDPARALRASLRMLGRLGAVNERLRTSHGVTLQARIGVNTGEVLASTEPSPGEALVTGDAVNTAARLQSWAEPGQVLASERTAQAARGFAYGERGALELKGKRERVRAFAVIAETSGAKRGVPGLHAPLVGRDSEIELLGSIWERVARESRPHLVTIYGDAGVGKSRLTQEFISTLESAEEPALVLRGRCLPYGSGITYWPLAEILKTHAGILDSDPAELAVEKVHKACKDLITGDVAADPVRAAGALAYTVGLEDPEVSFEGVDPKDVRLEVHGAWRSFFSALSSDGPVAVVVEDIHWADPVLLDLLEELAERVVGPVAFVCPSRPELSASRPAWGGGRRNMSSIALEPLSANDAGHLVRLLLTVDDLPPSVHSRILERAEGNPFYLEEVIRRLIDEGMLMHDAGSWRAGAGIEDVDIPDSVQAVLAARIDLLGPADKKVLQSAAVVGRVFWPGPVAELVGSADDQSPADALRRLEDRELVLSRLGSSLSGQPEFIFKHILTRDVAYGSLPLRERAVAHRTVARWLEETAGERAGEFAELLAYHYLTAVETTVRAGEKPEDGSRRAAWRWLLRASVDARRRQVLKKSQRLAEQALEMAATDLERVDALETLGDAFHSDYVGDLAWKYLRQAALTSSDAELEPRRTAYLCARACELPIRWPGSMRTLPSEADVQRLLDLGLENAPEGDSEERVRLLAARSGWPFNFPKETYTPEELQLFVDSGLEAARIASSIGQPNLASAAYDNAAGAFTSRGRYADAMKIEELRALIIDQVTDPFEIGDFYAMSAWGHYSLGNLTRASEICDEGLAATGGRAPNTEIHIRAWRVTILERLGQWDEALAEFSYFRDLLDERRDEPPYFATRAFTSAAMILDARAERVESDRLTEVIAALGRSPRAYAGMIRLLIARGEIDRAAAYEAERPLQWMIHGGDAMESFCELIAASGSWEAVPEALAEFRAHAEESGIKALPAFCDRLEGRAALAAGNATHAVTLLRRSAAAFETLGAPWELALTRADLADALGVVDREEEASGELGAAREILIGLGAVKDLARLERPG